MSKATDDCDDEELKVAETESASSGSSSKTTRSLGRWYVGETLGKGAYSWVKKGFDKKSGRPVALKFTMKADRTWKKKQRTQVIAEVQSLRRVRHKHVLKLFAYNLDAEYPAKDGSALKTVLLVLEYAPGGELFDILYYTSALEPIIARTYFRQLVAGLSACHAAGVCHRDLKPQNLLLDARFSLKIADFGLSKVFHADSDTVMRTTYVGTRGYQAPELLLKRPFDVSCDVFSAGVILFILLTGYPPFESAQKTDRWFRPIAKRDADKFWAQHSGCTISSDEACKQLLFHMLAYNPKRRATLEQVLKHEWTQQKVLDAKDLIRVLRMRHKKMEKARRRDAKKMDDLLDSVTYTKSRGVQPMDDVAFAAPLYPANETEGVWDTYTTAAPKRVLNVFHAAVCALEGDVQWNARALSLDGAVKLLAAEDSAEASLVRFCVRVFRSRLYGCEAAPVYAVRVQRLAGDVVDYRRVLTAALLPKCASVLTGLPPADRRTERRLFEDTSDAGDDAYETYEALLADEGLVFDE